MLLSRIADWAVAERDARLPADILHHAKRAVLDWFAALLPGAVVPPATLLRAALADEIGHGAALLYPDGPRAPARVAALVNGAASHTVEFDDVFRDAIYHPGCPTISAALALAQAEGADGERFLRAVIVGYEISNRIGMAVNPAHYRYWHTTGTVGCFGAAAAAASVLRLDGERTAHALATVGTFAAGLQQAFRSDAMSKPLHAGRAAEAGVLAALAAGKGVTGALDILEGRAGFGAAMAGGPSWDGIFDDLGRRCTIAETTFKNHGCCAHTFAAIDGALALRREHGLTPERIRRIRVGTYRTALDVTGSHRATTAFEGKFSLPFVVAAALVHGSVRLDAFSAARLADPRTQDLLRRVELHIDPELDAAFPGRRAARIEIERDDGSVLRHYQPTRKGDPDMPLSDEELTEKYLELAVPVIGEKRARRLRDVVWRLDESEIAELDAVMG